MATKFVETLTEITTTLRMVREIIFGTQIIIGDIETIRLT